MSEKRTRSDWDRSEWKGEGQGPASAVEEPTEEPATQWNKTEWAGDQGEGRPEPQDPEAMPEGESKLSGDRHPSGEEHWARGQAKKAD